MPSTPRSEVPHDEFQAHPAEVRPEGLPCPELAGVRDGSPRSRESDRLARTHRWQARQLELAEADAQEARPTTQVLEPRIETTVTLGLVFGLASRQTEGFLRSLLTLLNLDNDVPDHSTISRRKARLGKVASYERRTVKPVHLRIDSSGLSVHVGQLRTPPKARDYRKLHLAVDEHTSDVVACALTSKRARDASRVASLVGQIERPIASAKADAAYDTGDVYKTLENHRAHRSPKVLIPPRKGAQLALDSAGTRQRNRNIRARSRVGKRKWYVASGYSRRSKVETTFHRYKAILGSAMRARGLASQRVEVRLGCKILNTMTALGIPDGEMIG